MKLFWSGMTPWQPCLLSHSGAAVIREGSPPGSLGGDLVRLPRVNVPRELWRDRDGEWGGCMGKCQERGHGDTELH